VAIGCEPGQAWKGAAAATNSGAVIRLATTFCFTATCFRETFLKFARYWSFAIPLLFFLVWKICTEMRRIFGFLLICFIVFFYLVYLCLMVFF